MISYLHFIFNFLWDLEPSKREDHDWMEDGKEIYIVKKGRQITAEWRMERRFILLKKEGISQLKVKGNEFFIIFYI